MKKSKKENWKLAKILFAESFKNGKLDIFKIRRNIDFLKKSFRTRTLNILKFYLFKIKQDLKNKTLIIEGGQKIDFKYLKKIKNYFEKKYRSEFSINFHSNPKLLGGFKIILGDKEWDFSIKGKIVQMKEILSGRYY